MLNAFPNLHRRQLEMSGLPNSTTDPLGASCLAIDAGVSKRLIPLTGAEMCLPASENGQKRILLRLTIMLWPRSI